MDSIKNMQGQIFEKDYIAPEPPVYEELSQKSTEEISDEEFLKSVERLLNEIKQKSD